MVVTQVGVRVGDRTGTDFSPRIPTVTVFSLLFDDDEPLDVERRSRLHIHLLLARCSVSVSNVLRLLRLMTFVDPNRRHIAPASTVRSSKIRAENQ